MPKVVYTKNKGLVQSGGDDIQIDDGTLRLRAGATAANSPSMTVAWQAAHSLAASGHTLTIAMLKKGILYSDPTADRAWTLPTPALLVAGLPGYKAGDCIDFAVINTGTAGADEDITITAPGSGGTLVGSGHCPTSWTTHDADRSGSALFRIRITSSTAYVCYRLA